MAVEWTTSPVVQEPGEVSDGRRALQRHLQEVKQRQQASLAAQPRAASARSNSRSVGSALENHPRHQNKASEVAPSEVAPSALCDKGLGGSSTKGDRSEAGISNRQEGSTPSSAGAVEVRVTVPKASRSPGDSEEPVNKLNKPSSDSRAQSQLSAIRAQQPGENDPSTAGRGDRLQGGPSNPAADSQAAQKQRRPLSANTPGQSLQATAGSSPGNGRMATPKTVAAAKHGVLSRTAPVPDASHHVSKQQPVAESPGIITSATIARLAPHGGPQQPMNGNSTMGLQPSRGTAACTAGSKRKATDTHQLCADGSGHAHQSNATLPPSATPSPSSISPGVKRKKIMWDPALLQAAETQQLSPSHSLHVLSSGRRKKPKQPALTAQNTSLGGKLPSNGPLVQPPLPPQEPPQAADPQHQEEQAAGSPAGILGAKQEVKIFWSWGLGAAVQGQYGAHLMSMIPRSMNDQESGNTVLSHIALNSVLRLCLAFTLDSHGSSCLLIVQCKQRLLP